MAFNMSNRILKDGTVMHVSDVHIDYTIMYKKHESTMFSHNKIYKKLSSLSPKYHELSRQRSMLKAMQLYYKIIYKLQTLKLSLLKMSVSVKSINQIIKNMHGIESSKIICQHIDTLSQKLRTLFSNSLLHIEEIVELEDLLKVDFSLQTLYRVIMSSSRSSQQMLVLLYQLKRMCYKVATILIEFRFNVLQNNYHTDMSFVSYTVYQIDELMRKVDGLVTLTQIDNSINPDDKIYKKMKNTYVDINEYLKLIANANTLHVTKTLVNISLETFHTLLRENKDVKNRNLKNNVVSNVKTADYEIYESHFCHVCSRLLLTKHKQVSKILRKSYMKLICDEEAKLDTILTEIVHINHEILHRNSTVLFKKRNLNRQPSLTWSNKTIGWLNPLTPVEQNYLKKLYQEELWCNVRSLLFHVYIGEIMKDSNKCFCRINNSSQSNIERDCIWKCKLKMSEDNNVSPVFVQVLTDFIMFITLMHNSPRWDVGICQSMSLLLKDRFRYKKEISMASSSTINSCLRNQIFIQDQLKVINRKDMSVFQLKKELYENNILIPLNLFRWFLLIVLQSKRQQYLSSASWEPFFVVTSIDLKVIIYYLDRLQKTLITVFPDIQSEGSMVNDFHEKMKIFEESSFSLLVHTVSCRSKQLLNQNMPTLKSWRRRGSSVEAYQANSYVIIAVQSLFAPIIETFNCLSRMTSLKILYQCVTAFVKNWMEHILDRQYLFSLFGCQQLLFDFQYFLQCFENENFGLSAEEIADVQSLPIIMQMKNAIVLLSCQPRNNRHHRGYDNSSNPSEINGSSIIGSTQSILSQVSIESIDGSEFNQIIDSVDLHDKERWLALRAKGGSYKRSFLCIK